MSDSSYQNDIYIEQGGKNLYAKDGTKIIGESGSQIQADDGFSFYYNTGAVTADQMRRRCSGPINGIVTVGQSSDSTVLSVKNLPAYTRYLLISMTSTCVVGSLWLTSDVKIGDELYIILRAGSTQSGGIVFSTSGCSVEGFRHLAVSGFTLNNSSNSCGYAHLICVTDGTWSVVDFNASYVE